MLANVAITAQTRGVLKHHALFAVLLGNDVDDTCNSIAAIECTRRPLHNLNLLDIVRINEREVVLVAIITMQTPSVNQYQHIRVTQTVHLQSRTHVILTEVEARRQPRENVLNAFASILLQLSMTDDLRLYRRILQQVLGSSTCYNHLLQTVGAPYVTLCACANSQQPKANSQF